MKIYFAHSLLDYNTVKEKKALRILKDKFDEVVNPNDMGEAGSIVPYLAKITTCDATVAMEHKNHVGKGVFDEVLFTMLIEKPVYVIRAKSIYKIASLDVDNPTDWKINYGKITKGELYNAETEKV